MSHCVCLTISSFKELEKLHCNMGVSLKKNNFQLKKVQEQLQVLVAYYI